MTIHLIKLSVGSETLADLANWQAKRLAEMEKNHQKPELMHITRNTPKRAEDLLEGGSIYWVIKGWIYARQRLLELRPIIYNDMPHCGLVYDKELIHVKPRPHRAFQGWRYLQAGDAPPDLIKGDGVDELPEAMRKELSELGLL